MDQLAEKPLLLPGAIQNPYVKKYDNLGLTHFRSLKGIFADVRAGKITPENEDDIIALLAESTTEQQRTIDESFFDPLLREQGFYTRKHFYGHLNETITELKNNSTPREKNGQLQGEVLLSLDLDHFKLANDTYGHAWGDEVLQHVAGVIKQHVKRKQDFLGRSTTEQTSIPSENLSEDLKENEIGRPGGEELAALLYDVDIEGAVSLAEAIRKDLEEHPVQTPDGQNWQQTISIGVCFIKPGLTPEDVIQRADIALYHAKENGRNRVSVWQEGMAMPPSQPATVG